MKAAIATPRARVVVAVGSNSPDPPTLAAAAQLAQVVGGELAALFVEDVDLLRLAELPVAFEISATLPTPRPFAASDLERGFKIQAEELRRALAEVAGVLQLEFTFDVVRGKTAAALFDASAERDLVVLAGAAARALRHHAPPRVVRHALRAAVAGVKSRRVQPVAAALQSSVCAPRVLAVAHALARESGAALLVLLNARDASDAALAATVENWLEDQGASARIVAVPGGTPEEIAEHVAQADARALFWPGDGNFEMATSVEPLLMTIRCPLIVVR
jgi:hypothetical protein